MGGADFTEYEDGKFATEVFIKGGSGNPLVFKGTVKTVQDSTHFTSTDLIGSGDDAFVDWYVLVFHDVGGAAAAPQGEYKRISGYVSSSGAFTHTAFSAALAVGDEVIVVYENFVLNITLDAILAEVAGIDGANMRGTDNAALASVCTESRLSELASANLPADIDTLISRLTAARAGYLDELSAVNIPADIDAILAEVASIDTILANTDKILNPTRTDGNIAVTDAETTLFIDDAPSKIINGMSIKIDMSNMAAGDTYEFREYYRIESAGAYLEISNDVTVSGAQSCPLYVMKLEPYRYGMKVTAKKTAGTDRSFKIEVMREA